MSIVYTNSQNYTDIANAIRNKNGTATTYLPSEMAPAINALVSSSDIYKVILNESQSDSALLIPTCSYSELYAAYSNDKTIIFYNSNNELIETVSFYSYTSGTYTTETGYTFPNGSIKYVNRLSNSSGESIERMFCFGVINNIDTTRIDYETIYYDSSNTTAIASDVTNGKTFVGTSGVIIGTSNAIPPPQWFN